MNSPMLELATKRGELKARIEMQRDALGQHVWPIESALGIADRAVAGVHWAKEHPGAVGAVVAAVAILRPRRALRLARRGYSLWGSWKALRTHLFGTP